MLELCFLKELLGIYGLCVSTFMVTPCACACVLLCTVQTREDNGKNFSVDLPKDKCKEKRKGNKIYLPKDMWKEKRNIL